MGKIRVILVGGFLGAGKTTAIGRLARTYQQQGLNVGIVTNDQAADLVDTYALRKEGFEVGEVAGACFCCSFKDLTDTVASLEWRQRPDVILAEPVGSCTDLVATVIRPLARLYGDRYSVAPYGVILKPSHGRRILGGQAKAGFSPKAAYIFRKQLEEADFLILNRIDELQPDEIDSLQKLLEAESPETPVVRMSAKTGEGFDTLIEMLDKEERSGTRVVDVDYDVYAEGEAELGWLNSTLNLTRAEPFALDAILMEFVTQLQRNLEPESAEVAHLKVIGLSDGAHAVANLISSDEAPMLSVASDSETASAEVVVNARVAIDPARLRELFEATVQETAEKHGMRAALQQTKSFRPGRPVPTHRFDTVS